MFNTSVEIINNDNLDTKYIQDEIDDLEQTHNRQVKKIEFINLGDGTCKEVIEWYPIGFQRIRRITGYLVGDLDRFNDAKRAEVEDRVSHNV